MARTHRILVVCSVPSSGVSPASVRCRLDPQAAKEPYRKTLDDQESQALSIQWKAPPLHPPSQYVGRSQLMYMLSQPFPSALSRACDVRAKRIRPDASRMHQPIGNRPVLFAFESLRWTVVSFLDFFCTVLGPSLHFL